jgi:hypothetical protein
VKGRHFAAYRRFGEKKDQPSSDLQGKNTDAKNKHSGNAHRTPKKRQINAF